MRPFVFACLALSFAAPALAASRPDRSAAFAFEPPAVTAAQPLREWESYQAGEIAADSAQVHTGRYALRISRDSTSAGAFAAFGLGLPVDFAGDTIEVRGWLRTRDASGFAGLWLRADGRSGMLALENMHERKLDGTREWAAYRVALRLPPGTNKVYVGGLLEGTGSAWFDDFDVRVAGRPLADVPVVEAPLPALEADTTYASGSGVTLTAASRIQVENLALLGKVWGFLKYHHPQVVAGRRHWDFDLFRVLPDVLAARDRAGAQAALTRWLDALGPVPACAPCASAPEQPVLAPRLAWLSDRALLGDTLSARLRAIHANRPGAGEQFFVGFFPNVGNPDFGIELPYRQLTTPDAGYRLLALYRFWSMVEYWFPYRDVMDEDWDGVLRQFVPTLLGATTRLDYKRALLELVGRVHDTHCNLWGGLDARPPAGYWMPPVAIRFVAGRAVVWRWAHARLGPASGLRRGDVIESVDGVPVRTLVERWRPYYAASNEPTRLRDIARQLLAGDSTAAQVAIERDGRRLELAVARVPQDSLVYELAAYHDHPGPAFRRLGPDVAYLRLATAKGDSIEGYFARAAGARLLVIDDRSYPGDFTIFAIGGRLVSAPTSFAKFTHGDPANPGAFTFGPALRLEPIAPQFGGAVAILVDEVTQSSAEYHSLAFRAAPKAFVVGSTTAGADGNVSRILLPGGLSTMFSGIGVYWPDGRPTQRVGIVPDVPATPTVAGIRAGRDEVLEAAVRHALGRALTAQEAAALETP